jgi:hypothetical protein
MTNDFTMLIVENEFFGIKRVVSRKESYSMAKSLELQLVQINIKLGLM